MKRVFGSSRDVCGLNDTASPLFGFLFRGCQESNTHSWCQRNHFGHRR